MEFDREKFKALVHYVCWRCRSNPSSLGATKLNKILWLSDFLSYYHRDKPLTGARYVKRQFGPVPGAIVPVLGELAAEKKVNSKDVPFFKTIKREFIVSGAPDTALFTDEELKLVDSVTKYVTETHTARSISEESHDHIWQSAEDGEEIHYYTIFSVPGVITDDERDWARLELEAITR